MDIKFNVPFTTGKELEYINEVFSLGHFGGNGPFTKKCQEWLEQYLGAPRVLLTHSCTGALEMASMLLDIKEGDEFITPSYTFVTTASAFMRGGGEPVFCEIDEQMLLDVHDMESKISPETKALVPVHYAGSAPDMDKMVEISQNYSIPIVEDSAQGLGSKWNGKSLGTFGELGCISFHETKNIHSGLGGCLIVNDESLISKAEIIWERGTDRSLFLKGLVDKYTWREVGSSFYPSELQSAFLLAQLEELDGNLAYRKSIIEKYEKSLEELELNGNLRILKPSEKSQSNSHMFAIILDNEIITEKLRRHLVSNGIQAVIHYVPLHQSSVGKKLGYEKNHFPITENLAGRLLRLPLHHEIGNDQINEIAKQLTLFFDNS